MRFALSLMLCPGASTTIPPSVSEICSTLLTGLERQSNLWETVGHGKEDQISSAFQSIKPEQKSESSDRPKKSVPKRNLRIVKRVRNVPVLGICEYCNSQFSGEPSTGNAESAIQKQFNAHKCKSEDASQAD
jgi:hypothetical protein